MYSANDGENRVGSLPAPLIPGREIRWLQLLESALLDSIWYYLAVVYLTCSIRAVLQAVLVKA